MMQYSMNSFSSAFTFKRFMKDFAKEIYVNKQVIFPKFHFDTPFFRKSSVPMPADEMTEVCLNMSIFQCFRELFH